MARKTSNFTIKEEGRDKGKTFVLTEMSAYKAEQWAMKALLALMNSGVQVPEGFEKMGMAGVAEIGIRALAGLKWEIAEPLLNEMLTCVRIMPDITKPHVVRDLIEEDIEEVKTLLTLRSEVWKLHTDFLKAVAPSTFAGSPATARNKKVSQNT